MRKRAIFGSIAAFIFLFLALSDFKTDPVESSIQDTNKNTLPLTSLGSSNALSPLDDNAHREELPYALMIEPEIMPVSEATESATDSDSPLTEAMLPSNPDPDPLDRNDTTRALALVNIAQDFLNKNFYDEGIPWVKDAIRLDPGLPEAHLVSGYLNFNLRNRDQAISAFERTIELDPLNFEAHLYLGIIYNGNNNPLLAVEYFSTAIRIASTPEEISTAYTHRALAFALLERFDECFADLDDAVYLDPANDMAILVRGTVIKDLEKWEKATSEIEDIPGVSECFTE
jgi:tetratricopeptide (TPR) repeat protein